jgi:putative aldouronate transport system permease protein
MMGISKSMSENNKGILSKIYKQKLLFLMSVPFVIYLIVFSYIPVWGWLFAFFDYKPGHNILKSKFVGLKYFNELLSSPDFYLALRNTLALNFLSLILGTASAILFAILLNEIKHMAFKKLIQTASYLPHFVSWVIVAGIFTSFLSIDNGPVNYILLKLHLIDEAYPFMMEGKLFWWIITYANIWKETGWNAIIYLAVIVSINPEQYESAIVDGANRFRRIWHITLPGIKNTVVVMTVLSIGWILGGGFEQSMLMGNGMIMEYSDVISTYVARYGINMARYSYATAAGIFQSVVGIILIVSANFLSKRLTDTKVL